MRHAGALRKVTGRTYPLGWGAYTVSPLTYAEACETANSVESISVSYLITHTRNTHMLDLFIFSMIFSVLMIAETAAIHTGLRKRPNSK